MLILSFVCTVSSLVTTFMSERFKVEKIHNVTTLSQKVRKYVVPGDASRKWREQGSFPCYLKHSTPAGSRVDSWKQQEVSKCGDYPVPWEPLVSRAWAGGYLGTLYCETSPALALWLHSSDPQIPRHSDNMMLFWQAAQLQAFRVSLGPRCMEHDISCRWQNYDIVLTDLWNLLFAYTHCQSFFLVIWQWCLQ